MRTNIDIDDKLMKQAMKATGATTKKAAVEAALRRIVQLKKQERILKWFGKIDWEGDLDAMRESRFPEWHGLDEKPAAKDTGENAA
ncbi:MAG TPA: type II toxin-antitoxin system VapB family antitoxin [Terracidiphilus sp.]|jgi:Arc/MetJ family transcription regulator|nr:type II toxin-antitoxin system VapB family antitoxin [Terracidiphilus sp.]